MTSIYKHIQLNFRFSLKMVRDLIRILFRSKKLIAHYAYHGDLFGDSSNIVEAKFDEFRRDIAKNINSNYFALTYNGSTFWHLWNNFIADSQIFQMIRWYRFTKFLSCLDDEILIKYYESQYGRTYCGFLKLNNSSWVRTRVEQFTFLNTLSDRQFYSYLEVGGASGVLPLFAAYLGFKKVVNTDFNEEDLNLSIKVSQKLGLNCFSASVPYTCRDKFDVVSCHQVIEHTNDPENFLTELMGYLNEGGILILSHGYHLPVYPGHIPSLNEEKLLALCQEHSLEVLSEGHGNTLYLQRAIKMKLCGNSSTQP